MLSLRLRDRPFSATDHDRLFELQDTFWRHFQVATHYFFYIAMCGLYRPQQNQKRIDARNDPAKVIAHDIGNVAL